jgi:hypothetical protein
LDDGGEVDLDLGNYERFLDITLHRDNNITTGKIYQHKLVPKFLWNLFILYGYWPFFKNFFYQF